MISVNNGQLASILVLDRKQRQLVCPSCRTRFGSYAIMFNICPICGLKLKHKKYKEE